MTIEESAWTKAIEALQAAEHPVLSCHLGPDGDALGSMIALAIALHKQGRAVTASYSEPFDIPKQYAFFPGLDLLKHPNEVPDEPELLITFDAGSIDRLGTLTDKAKKAKTLIVVDHHRSNDHFGHINLIDPNAAASAVLVFELLERLKIDLDKDIATCLYTGLVTDTGRFQYQNTTPKVMKIAAELLEHKIEHDRIARIIYDTHPVGYLRLLSVALHRLVINTHASMVWTWITNHDLKEADIGLDDTEALIDVVRTADVAEVALVLKETPQGTFKASMRSKGKADVGKVCESFGGGGHALAAGFTSPLHDPAEIAKQIAAKLT
ncbi:MAG: DHH family phosphoesterase [Actinomycetota bacterium]